VVEALDRDVDDVNSGPARGQPREQTAASHDLVVGVG